MADRRERMWVTWEQQRRSEEMARRLGCSFHLVAVNGLRRYPVSIARTLALLIRRRPRYLFVQNPSMILAALACLYGVLTRRIVVVDRHTTFLLNKPKTFSLRRAVFFLLHRFTLRTADITIVTNRYLARLVEMEGGRPFVLPDPIPNLSPTTIPKLRGSRNVLVISSFAEDEPIAEILEAARQLESPDVAVYISGNPSKGTADWPSLAPPNVIFTGFIPTADFINLLFAVDVVMVLTTADHCMLCGCYEAVAATKPLITSDKEDLRAYFRGAEFVQASSDSILQALRLVLSDSPTYQSRTATMKDDIVRTWGLAFTELEAMILRVSHRLRSNIGSVESRRTHT